MTSVHTQPPADEIAIASSIRRIRRRASQRAVSVTCALMLLTAVLFMTDLIYGHEIYAIDDVVAVLAGRDVPGVSFIIGELRLPRAIIGVFSGLAFGMAGASFQHLLRNLLASPDIIGITAGANTAAVFGIIVLGWSGVPLSMLAMAGGILTAIAVSWLAWTGSFAPNRLILMGIGVAAMLSAASSWILIRGDQWDIQSASRWLTGSLSSADWVDVPFLVTVVIVAGILLIMNNRRVDVMRFGEQTATGLGVRVNVTQVSVIVLAVLMLSAATAASGPIAFVSFLAGPIAARLVGPHQPAIAQAGLVGACLVIAADIIAQHAPSTQMPVGVVTSILGGPILVALLIRWTHRQELS